MQAPPRAADRGAPRPAGRGGEWLPATAPSRTLRAWSATDKDAAVRAVAGAVRGWQGDWRDPGPALEAGAVSCRAPLEDASGRASGREEPWRSERPGLWWRLAPPDVRSDATPLPAIAAALFAGPAASSADEKGAGGLAGELAGASWSDLWDRLETAIGSRSGGAEQAATLDERPAAHWSGALELAFPWVRGELCLLVSGTRLERLLRSGPRPSRPLVPSPQAVSPLQAMGDRKLRLRVHSSPFELELGILAGLRVGDVIQTTHTLEAPLAVSIDGEATGAGPALFAAFLGRAGAQRAVELRHARDQQRAPPPSAGPTHSRSGAETHDLPHAP